MKQSHLDSSFEKYRRDRTFRRLQSAADQEDAKASSVLKQLEAAERSELRSETLSREVHDFFADATRTAAGIVQQISDTHEERTDLRLQSEIADFLQDVIRRAESFMIAIQSQRAPGASQTEVEATIRNIVGTQLDGFRAEGTARLDDKHFGQDPFFVPAETGPRASPARAASPSGSLEDHSDGSHTVARARLPEPDLDPQGWVETEAHEPTPALKSIERRLSVPTPSPGALTAEAEITPLPGLPKDPAKLRATLKALVKTGVLDRDAAQSMYRALMTRK